MAYSTSNPPRLQSQALVGGRVWYYTSADATATVDGSGYFTDGYELGMRDGDLLIHYDSNLKVAYMNVVEILTGTTIDLADGTVVGSTTNSD